MSETAHFRRSPDDVMRLSRMGSFHPSRLSFMQTLLRRLEREKWSFERRLFQIDARGVGEAIYTVQGPERAYSLIAFGHDLPDEMRSDRVIATAWDATFALFDGIPQPADIRRLSAQVPLQEAGRISERELCLSRANRSARLFNHVVDSLAAGRQPDAGQVRSVGYLMRTTAVYGSGKFGAADRSDIADRAELRGPFQAEMLTVWLIRAFVLDLVEHMARLKGGDAAVPLEPGLRRSLGIGNSTGLGMAPFLVNHPILLNNWMLVREEALARVRAQSDATDDAIRRFQDGLHAARENAAIWQSDHPLQQQKLSDLRGDLDQIATRTLDGQDHPWNRLWVWGQENLHFEGQEALASLLIDAHPELVDGLSDCMDADEDRGFRIDGSMTVARLMGILQSNYHWALDQDYDAPQGQARFWYVSEEKLEPRLGERFEEPGADYEQPLAVGRDAKRLYQSLSDWDGKGTLSEFLLAHPEHRHIVRRAQRSVRYPFSEIHDNLIAADMLPIDMLRCKLSFFGATRFDPRSDRWVRICMYQDAPFPNELLESTT